MFYNVTENKREVIVVNKEVLHVLIKDRTKILIFTYIRGPYKIRHSNKRNLGKAKDKNN